MKIDPQQLTGLTGSQNASQITLSPAKSAQPSSIDNSGDRAEISGLSQAIQTFQGARASRISQVASLVQSGKYNVDPALISQGIVNEALGGGQVSAPTYN
jgi:anti-sigma28 factor (negative regulator of flagellin synthesis)